LRVHAQCESRVCVRAYLEKHVHLVAHNLLKLCPADLPVRVAQRAVEGDVHEVGLGQVYPRILPGTLGVFEVNNHNRLIFFDDEPKSSCH
jgi:hypothetical protein